MLTKLSGGVGSKLVLLPSNKTGLVMPGDNSRIRYPVDANKSAEAIIRSLPIGKDRIAPPAAVLEWLSWDRIANEFLKLMP
jgi:hypothetical protein